MEHPGFFERVPPVPLGALAEKLGAELGSGADPAELIHSVKPLAEAARGELCFFENRKYMSQLERTRDTWDSPDASGDAIAQAFERYLRRRGEGPGDLKR